jgi:hypothetical protein
MRIAPPQFAGNAEYRQAFEKLMSAKLTGLCGKPRLIDEGMLFTSMCLSSRCCCIATSMKRLVFILFFPAIFSAYGQKRELAADPNIPIPKVEINAKGDLKIMASPGSSPTDFDFLVGKWKMHNRHLDKRLADCHNWTEFDSSDVNIKMLNGAADMDTYSTTQFPGSEGRLFEGLTLRLFDRKTRLWSLYWIASNTGTIDPPVVGSFDENGVGHFFGKDTLNGKPILVVFRWDARNKNRPIWGQAFSPDNGKTWEWNFFNVSERINN